MCNPRAYTAAYLYACVISGLVIYERKIEFQSVNYSLTTFKKKFGKYGGEFGVVVLTF